MGGLAGTTARVTRRHAEGGGRDGRSDQDPWTFGSRGGFSEPPLTRPTTARWPWTAEEPESALTLTTDAVAWCERNVRGVRPRVEVRRGATTFAVRRRSETTAPDQELILSC